MISVYRPPLATEHTHRVLQPGTKIVFVIHHLVTGPSCRDVLVVTFRRLLDLPSGPVVQ
jgi:hypothetical protein